MIFLKYDFSECVYLIGTVKTLIIIKVIDRPFCIFSCSHYGCGDLQALPAEIVLPLERLGKVRCRAIFCTPSLSFYS
jgi:hypothetical protein